MRTKKMGAGEPASRVSGVLLNESLFNQRPCRPPPAGVLAGRNPAHLDGSWKRKIPPEKLIFPGLPTPRISIINHTALFCSQAIGYGCKHNENDYDSRERINQLLILEAKQFSGASAGIAGCLIAIRIFVLAGR